MSPFEPLWRHITIITGFALAPPGKACHTPAMRIMVAVSGGADSLFALLSLKEQGHDVTALHARLLPTQDRVGDDPVPGMAALCARLGIPLRVADLTADFQERVIAPFIKEHAAARTPNPCALCNRGIKFGKLLDTALDMGGEALATGHYAAMEEHPVYGLALKAGTDTAKDQSYFLALTPRERLRRCLFPLAGERKPHVLEWLRAQGETPPVPKESQEICFVPHNDHLAFLTASGASLPGPGPVMLTEDMGENAPASGTAKIIGRHQGLWRYTEGQRKGLGIAWSEPLFVLRRDKERNTLMVGPQRLLLADACVASAANYLVEPALWPARLSVRVRYRQKPAEALVQTQGDRLLIRFESSQAPPAPGQIAAVYDEDGFVLAGGVLD